MRPRRSTRPPTRRCRRTARSARRARRRPDVRGHRSRRPRDRARGPRPPRVKPGRVDGARRKRQDAPMTETATVMLVHGAWHGSWCWDAVREHLHAAGVASAVVDNPSVTKPGSDLAADGDNLRRALDAIDGPGRARRAFLRRCGDQRRGRAPERRAPRLPDRARPRRRGECGRERTHRRRGHGPACGDGVRRRHGHDRARTCRRPLLPRLFLGSRVRGRLATTPDVDGGDDRRSSRGAAWRERPTTYVVCTDDRALPVPLQRSAAARIGNTIEMATSHSPFLSRPDDLAVCWPSSPRGEPKAALSDMTTAEPVASWSFCTKVHTDVGTRRGLRRSAARSRVKLCDYRGHAR